MFWSPVKLPESKPTWVVDTRPVQRTELEIIRAFVERVEKRGAEMMDQVVCASASQRAVIMTHALKDELAALEVEVKE